MEKIIWMDKVRHEEVLEGVSGKITLGTIRKMKKTFIGFWLRSLCQLVDVLDAMVEDERKRERKRYQLQDDTKAERNYEKARRSAES